MAKKKAVGDIQDLQYLLAIQRTVNALQETANANLLLLESIQQTQITIPSVITQIQADVAELLANSRKVVDITVKPTISEDLLKEGDPMKCAISKHTAQHAPLQKMGKGAAPQGFNLADNGNGTYTVQGTTQGGNNVDISAVATLAVSSATPAIAAAALTTGMNFSVTAATPAPAIGATVAVTLTATWNDGSVGPFTIVVTYTVIASPVTGITVQPTSAQVK